MVDWVDWWLVANQGNSEVRADQFVFLRSDSCGRVRAFVSARSCPCVRVRAVASVRSCPRVRVRAVGLMRPRPCVRVRAFVSVRSCPCGSMSPSLLGRVGRGSGRGGSDAVAAGEGVLRNKNPITLPARSSRSSRRGFFAILPKGILRDPPEGDSSRNLVGVVLSIQLLPIDNPERIQAISRWLSAAIPPEQLRRKYDPERVAAKMLRPFQGRKMKRLVIRRYRCAQPPANS